MSVAPTVHSSGSEQRKDEALWVWCIRGQNPKLAGFENFRGGVERGSSNQRKHSTCPISVKITGWPPNYTGTKAAKGPRLKGSVRSKMKSRDVSCFLLQGSQRLELEFRQLTTYTKIKLFRQTEQNPDSLKCIFTA